jgi:hypothetical protein
MVSPGYQTSIEALIDIEWPQIDLLAVVPYVIPLLFFGTIILLYQRYMPQEDKKRNLLVLIIISCYTASFFLVLYAGYGAVWWGPDELTFGSWWPFMGAIGWLTNTVFGSIIVGTIYILAVSLVFAIVASRVIAPPEPDFVSLRNDLKETQEEAKFMKAKAQKLEGENKQLKEFVSDKEKALTILQEELESLKKSFSEKEATMMAQLREATLVAESEVIPGPGPEEELLQTISKKDRTISELQSEISQLKSLLETSGVEPAVGLDAASKSKLDDYSRRAETATEIADTVISDLAKLMSMIDSSSLEPSAKSAITNLVSGLGRVIGKVAGSREREGPKIEMIGAVMMLHELIDGIKRQIQKA